MAETVKRFLIVNPVAGNIPSKAKIIDIQHHLREALGGNLELIFTSRPEEATKLTSDAIQAGAIAVFAAGGDGTINEVINGFFAADQLINPVCKLGILNFGTGQGFAQSIDYPIKLEEQVQILEQQNHMLIDVGRLEYRRPNGSIAVRYFINECQLGIGAQVVAKVKQGHKKLGGRLAFGLVTLREALSAPFYDLKISVDKGPPQKHELLGLAICNGSKMAAGMQLCPDAQVNDQVFDLLLIKKMSVVQRLRNFPKIYTGQHLNSSKFEIIKARSLEVTAKSPVLVETDGELLGMLPIKIELMPQQIPIKFKSI